MANPPQIDHVSVSQLDKFRSCPAAWYFDKVLKLPQEKPFGVMLKIGSCMHNLFKEYGAQFVGLTDNWIYERLVTEAPLAEGLTETDYRDLIQVVRAKIMTELLYFDREHIEVPINQVIGGVKFLGFVDFIKAKRLPDGKWDAAGQIGDWKFKGSGAEEPDPAHRDQGCFYSLCTGIGRVWDCYFIINKRKKNDRVEMVEHQYLFTPEDHKLLLAEYAEIHRAMAAGINYANPNHIWCSYCGYQTACKKRHGGIRKGDSK